MVHPGSIGFLLFALQACGGTPAPAAKEGTVTPEPTATASRESTATAPPEPGLAPSGPAHPQVGQAGPDWELPRLLADGSVHLQDLRGQTVLVTFWASWCGPCRHEIPALEGMWKSRREQGLTVVGVSVDDEKADALAFLELFPVSYPIVWDRGGKTVGDPWGVSNLPTAFLLDRQGVVRSQHVGWNAGTMDQWSQEIDALLAQR
jgi:peroxiredoxin